MADVEAPGGVVRIKLDPRQISKAGCWLQLTRARLVDPYRKLTRGLLFCREAAWLLLSERNLIQSN